MTRLRSDANWNGSFSRKLQNRLRAAGCIAWCPRFAPPFGARQFQVLGGWGANLGEASPDQRSIFPLLGKMEKTARGAGAGRPFLTFVVVAPYWRVGQGRGGSARLKPCPFTLLSARPLPARAGTPAFTFSLPAALPPTSRAKAAQEMGHPFSWCCRGKVWLGGVEIAAYEGKVKVVEIREDG